MVFSRFDRWGNIIGSLHVLEADYQVSTAGIDQLSILTFEDLDKGDRIVWKDADTGEYHEHEVSETKRVHDSNGKPLTSATCINSICELYGDPYSSASDWPSGQEILANPGAAISGALVAANSTWEYGGTGGYGTDVLSEELTITVDNDSTRSFIAKIVNARSAELRTRFTQTDGRITGRTICIYGTPLMEDPLATPKHRFTYEKNLPSVTREVLSDEVYTAVRGIGAQITSDDSETDSDTEEETTPEYLTCEVRANNDILNAWGRPGADNTKKHVWTYYQDSNCDDLEYLSAECAYYLDSVCTPKVQYTCNITYMGNCDIGDYVDVIDKGFNPPVRMRARITEIRKNLLDTVHGGTITIGPPNYPMLEAYVKQEKAAESDSQSVTARTTTKISSLDKQINSSSGIKAKVGTLDNQINSRSLTSPGLQMQIDEINDWIDEHGSGGGGTGKFSWWDLQTDSFAFFDNAFNSSGTLVGPKFGITGKENGKLGCYAKGEIDPDPANKTWLEGAEIWSAINATDHADSVSKSWLRVPKIDTAGMASGGLATPKLALTQNPQSQYNYISQIVRPNLYDIGFFNSTNYGIKNQAGGPLPMFAIQPNQSGHGVTLLTGIDDTVSFRGPQNGYSGCAFLYASSYNTSNVLRSTTQLQALDGALNQAGGVTPAASIALSTSRDTSIYNGACNGSLLMEARSNVSGSYNAFVSLEPYNPNAEDSSTWARNGCIKIGWSGLSSPRGRHWRLTYDGKLYYDNKLLLDANA